MKKIRVTTVTCPECNTEMFSRARHDFRYCPCGTVFVDGGFDYLRFGFKDTKPRIRVRYTTQTRRELFDDWNRTLDKYGRIKL